MVPSPQEHSINNGEIPQQGNRVVISGISGLFPQAQSVKELSHILYNKENPITKEEDWSFNHPESAKYFGKNPDLNHFDAQFFMVHYRLCQAMDPMTRKIMEQTYQAIYDAGLSPDHLNGKNVAVYTGCAFSETETCGMFDNFLKTSFGVLGCSKTMSANRISYWLNAKGPSVSINGSCSGAMVALEQAYMDLSSGRCDAAIVGASHMTFLANYSIHYGRAMELSPDGKTRSFDQNANGLGMSDATIVFFLQRAKDALRIYGELVNVRNEFTQIKSKDQSHEFSFCRNPEIAVKFLENFYRDSQVSPDAVEYVEAFGSAIPDADKLELETIDQIYCQNRSKPLLVGSVMSNVGHTEAAMGLTAITKVLLGYETGVLASNLHCNNPRQDVNGILDGRISILTEHTSFDRSYAAVNLHSFSGISSHALLHGHYKPRNSALYRSNIPYLVTISNRTEKGVQKIVDDLKSRPINPEELALLHNIHSRNISGHLGRGYTILHTNGDETVSLREEAEYFDSAKPPLWFVYSGMGSQWAGMGAQLMRIPVFAAAIERCHQILAPKGVDIVHIITSPDKTIFDNVINSFLGIAAIQIGLTDILKHLGLVPDNIIGHSVGELGCAYADGCLTAEEMMLSAFNRGVISNETQFIKGSMAAVGLGYEKMRDLCPPEIDVACHNGPDSSTISGPFDVMSQFIAKLTAMGIFAKEVPCGNIPYHSRYIAPAGLQLKKYLSEVIINPKLRSKKWLSTSIPQNKWNELEAQYCSAEYQTNNLLRPVLFEETSRLIPANAVVVEVAPHGLLQAILKRSLSSSCRHVALTKRGHQDSVLFLLDAVGKLYMEGYTPNIQELYPKVEFPVSAGTPMLSHLVEWNHSEEWDLPRHLTLDRKQAAACKFLISLHDDEHNFLKGNMIGGQVLYPFSASLVAVWDTLAMSLGVTKKSRSVVLSDVHLYAQPVLFDQRLLEVQVALNRGSGLFEVSNKVAKIVSGFIRLSFEQHKENLCPNVETYEHKLEEVYELFKERDYSYSDDFRCIHSVNSSLNKAYVKWNDNWVTHIDGLLQLNALKRTHDGVSQPVYIKKLLIDVKKHENSLNIDNITVMKAEISDTHDYTRCGGISLHNIRFRDVPHHNQYNFKLLTPTPDGKTKDVDDNNVSVKNKIAASHMTLRSANIGGSDSLQWVETAAPSGPGVKVTVCYAGLNSKDVKLATEAVAEELNDNSYGMDFSGITESGCRVMGVVPRGACSSELRAAPELLWPVPDHWSLEDAATVPFSYACAFYCLCVKTESLVNKSILVHGGAGALGQAAIAIALAHGCQVFTTVGDSRKIHFLRKLYPALKEEHIGNSRDGSFGDMVLIATKGRGCDIIISSVDEDLKDISLKCAAFNGVTFDTVQILNKEEFQYGMYHMTKQRSYIALDFSSIFDKQNHAERKTLQLLVSEGIARGYVRPLSRVTYAPHDAPRAFRLLAASAHRGRVLLDLRDTDVRVLPRITCSAHLCNVLICDGSALSVHLANRLIQRGAKNLYIYTINSASISKIKMQFWENIGVHVEVSSGVLSDNDAVHKLLNSAHRLGYVEGIYLVATDLNETITNQELTTLATNIDVASKSICPNAKYITILTTGLSIEPMTRVVRAIDHIPTTLLNISVPKTGLPQTRLGSWCRGVIDTLERAINNRHGVLVAQELQLQQKSLMQDIIRLSGIDIFNEYRDDATLEMMGLHEADAKAIRSYLLHVYNTSLSEGEVLRLDKQKLRELELTLEERIFDEVKGLARFFPRVEPDDLLASVETVFLPTGARPIITNADDFDGINAYLCIIPGLEGLSASFRGLCERLKLPAMVLQPGLDRPYETIQDTAKRFAKIIIEKIGLKNHFYLLGYETGILIALEIAAILETHGIDGTVFCVGCAPEHVRSVVEKELNKYATETELQNAIIQHMFTLMTNADIAILHKALRDKTTWEDKVEACIKPLQGRIKYSVQYAQAIIEAAYGRLREAYRYNYTAKPLKSRVIIMASPDSVSSISHMFQAEAVHELKAPFSRALEDMRCSSLINKYLSPDIIKEFEDKNWCELYFEDYRIRFSDS